MKKSLIIMSLIAISIYSFGCTKKKPAMDESQELLSMDQMSVVTSTPVVPAVTQPAAAPVMDQAAALDPAAAAGLPVVPAGPYKPSGTDIQTALKNAGFYTGTVDGKIGPMTREAIEDFQKANGLEADGKVGPKTWAAMAKYLTQKASDALTENALLPTGTGK